MSTTASSLCRPWELNSESSFEVKMWKEKLQEASVVRCSQMQLDVLHENSRSDEVMKKRRGGFGMMVCCCNKTTLLVASSQGRDKRPVRISGRNLTFLQTSRMKVLPSASSSSPIQCDDEINLANVEAGSKMGTQRSCQYWSWPSETQITACTSRIQCFHLAGRRGGS